MKVHWRRFVPHRTKLAAVLPQDSFAQAEALVAQLTSRRSLRRTKIADLEPAIDQMRSRQDLVSLLTMLILQSPRAASAQREMDGHPYGYHDRNKRLYELIDFNDVFVACVLATPDNQLNTFNDQAKWAMDRFCKKLGVKCFSNEQWQAITHGLSREVAVYLGARHEGLDALMTSRVQDAKGIDMVISDRVQRLSMNVDIKTRSSYHFRLKDLLREGRITAEQLDRAERDGYCRVVNGQGSDAVKVVLLRIDDESFGEVADFQFEHAERLGEELRNILKQLSDH